MMTYLIAKFTVPLLLGAAMPLMSYLAHRRSRRLFLAREGTVPLPSNSVEAAVFGLLGLLLAFTFSTAYSRLDQRRRLIVEEVNAVGTAYLRLDLLPPEAHPELRELFKDYVDSRLQYWEKVIDTAEAMRELDRTVQIQQQIWSRAVHASEKDPSTRMLVLPALNAMIDITTIRLNAMRSHPPDEIFLMLVALALLCAWLVGDGMGKLPRVNWLQVIGFAFVIMLTIYVTLDIEYPRVGMVRLDSTHQLLIDLRQSMK